MEQENQAPEVLLVQEKDEKKLKVVTGLNEDGTPQSKAPTKENEPEFLRIDKNSNTLENFMSNFLRQCKEPTHFQFYKAPLEGLEKLSMVLERFLKDPENPAHKSMLDQERIIPENFSNKQSEGIDPAKINWDQLSALGITKDQLEKTNSLDKMLRWSKSTLLPIRMEVAGVSLETEARLSFKQKQDGTITLNVHGIKQKPDLDKPFYGTMLSDEVKKNLLETGNAGEVIPIKANDKDLNVYLSIDKLTNQLVAVRIDKIQLPDEVCSVRLSEEQKQGLKEGKSVYVESMVGKSGKVFNANLQLNADKRGLDFKFSNTPNQSQTQTQSTEINIPTKLKGQELSKEQQQDLRQGKTIYVESMLGNDNKTFNAYVRVNFDENKIKFSRNNPDQTQKAETANKNNISKKETTEEVKKKTTIKR